MKIGFQNYFTYSRRRILCVFTYQRDSSMRSFYGVVFCCRSFLCLQRKPYLFCKIELVITLFSKQLTTCFSNIDSRYWRRIFIPRSGYLFLLKYKNWRSMKLHIISKIWLRVMTVSDYKLNQFWHSGTRFRPSLSLFKSADSKKFCREKKIAERNKFEEERYLQREINFAEKKKSQRERNLQRERYLQTEINFAERKNRREK